MALATSTIIGLAVAAAAAAGKAYQTHEVQKDQDASLAKDIRNQGDKRREAEAKTNAEIERLKLSSSEDERAGKLAMYTDAIRKHGVDSTRGLDGANGGADFQAESAQAAQSVMNYGLDHADLMSRLDAPIDQRTNESVSFGNLGIDMETIAREAQGRHFLDQLRTQGIQANPWVTAGLDFLGSAGSAMAGGAMGGVPSGGITSGQGISAVGTGGGTASSILSKYGSAIGKMPYGKGNLILGS